MVVGIIAEYNPFHNGHRYQIEQIRKKFKNADIITVMSGNFTQRGEPAILDKFTRAKLAVNGGCDLVLELPFVYAVRSAQDFARGGVNLLKKLGIVDVLAFGAEIDDINLLIKVANIIDTVDFSEHLRSKLELGLSYANATCQTLSKISGIDEKILRLPNIILAIEYLRVLRSTSIQPLLVARMSAKHDDDRLHSYISSATAIRNSIYSTMPQWDKLEKNIDSKTMIALQSADLPMIENLFRPIITKILCSTTRNLRNIYGITEGLENKIINATFLAKNFNDFVNCIVSQRYTRSRIQRLLLYLIIGLKKDQVAQCNESNYARILAFNQRGCELIKLIKKHSSIPVITKITQHINSRAIYGEDIQNPYQRILKFDIISSDIYSILKDNVKLGKDFYNSPAYLH